MAGKLFLSSSSLLTCMTKGIYSSAQQTAGYIRQHQLSQLVAASRTLSVFPRATFLGSTLSDTRSEPIKSICSLYMCGNHGQGTVLANNFKPGDLQIRGYQNALRPRLICDGCYFVWRHNRRFVECSDHPRHKQMKRVATRKVWQEDYSKGNISKAMDWHKRFPREFAREADRTSLSHNWLAGKLGKEL